MTAIIITQYAVLTSPETLATESDLQRGADAFFLGASLISAIYTTKIFFQSNFARRFGRWLLGFTIRVLKVTAESMLTVFFLEAVDRPFAHFFILWRLFSPAHPNRVLFSFPGKVITILVMIAILLFEHRVRNTGNPETRYWSLPITPNGWFFDNT